MEIVLSGVRPYDGTYSLDFADDLTTREFGWIKRLSGYLPLQLEDAVEGGDPEFVCVLAAIALHRAGRVDAREVPQLFERLVDAPFGSTIRVNLDETVDEDEGDADPPENSNGSGSISGPDSPTSSETSQPVIPHVSGTRDSATSASDRSTSGS